MRNKFLHRAALAGLCLSVPMPAFPAETQKAQPAEIDPACVAHYNQLAELLQAGQLVNEVWIGWALTLENNVKVGSTACPPIPTEPKVREQPALPEATQDQSTPAPIDPVCKALYQQIKEDIANKKPVAPEKLEWALQLGLDAMEGRPCAPFSGGEG